MLKTKQAFLTFLKFSNLKKVFLQDVAMIVGIGFFVKHLDGSLVKLFYGFCHCDTHSARGSFSGGAFWQLLMLSRVEFDISF